MDSPSHSDTLINRKSDHASDDDSRSLSPISFPADPATPTNIKSKSSSSSSRLRRRRSSSRSHSASTPGTAMPMPPPPHTRAWYEFDLAVVVALVSPVGNWLTGGDHVKNILIIALLIFYLHQIIEVPWELYQKARPRRPSPTPDSPTSTTTTISTLAASELRTIEFLFLLLATLSPILGALLLRYVTVTLLGDPTTSTPTPTVSWFSTSLFVLATGVRPWTHLVERITWRTGALHAAVHYPVPPSPFAFPLAEEHKRELEGVREGVQDVRAEVRELRARVGELARAVEGVRGAVVGELEEVYACVDEVQRGVRRVEGRVGGCEGRVGVLEVVREGGKGEEGGRGGAKEVLWWFVPAWVTVPFSLPNRTSKPTPAPTPTPTPTRPRSKPTLTSSPPRSFRSSSSLATIHEEEHAHRDHAQSGGNVRFDDERVLHKSKSTRKSKSKAKSNGVNTNTAEGVDQPSDEDEHTSDSDAGYDHLSPSGTGTSEEEEEVRYTLARSPPNKIRTQKHTQQAQTETESLPALAVYALTFPLRVLGRVFWVLGGR